MKIEDILKQLSNKGIPAVVMVIANEGYSVIPMSKEIYRTLFLMQEHWNGETIKDALLNLLNNKEA